MPSTACLADAYTTASPPPAPVLRRLQYHRRERLVHFDDARVVEREPRLRQGLLHRLRVAVQHPRRVDAGEAERDEARGRLQAEPRDTRIARDQRRRVAVDDL